MPVRNLPPPNPEWPPHLKPIGGERKLRSGACPCNRCRYHAWRADCRRRRAAGLRLMPDRPLPDADQPRRCPCTNCKNHRKSEARRRERKGLMPGGRQAPSTHIQDRRAAGRRGGRGRWAGIPPEERRAAMRSVLSARWAKRKNGRAGSSR